jgi:hypothetical protein
MPTLLYLLELPVPDGLDGNVLLELFDEEWVDAHPVVMRRVEEAEQGLTAAVQYSDQDEAAIEERLKGLGYLG